MPPQPDKPPAKTMTQKMTTDAAFFISELLRRKSQQTLSQRCISNIRARTHSAAGILRRRSSNALQRWRGASNRSGLVKTDPRPKRTIRRAFSQKRTIWYIRPLPRNGRAPILDAPPPFWHHAFV